MSAHELSDVGRREPEPGTSEWLPAGMDPVPDAPAPSPKVVPLQPATWSPAADTAPQAVATLSTRLPRDRRRLVMIACALLVVVLVAGGAYLVKRHSDHGSTQAQAAAAQQSAVQAAQTAQTRKQNAARSAAAHRFAHGQLATEHRTLVKSRKQARLAAAKRKFIAEIRAVRARRAAAAHSTAVRTTVVRRTTSSAPVRTTAAAPVHHTTSSAAPVVNSSPPRSQDPAGRHSP